MLQCVNVAANVNGMCFQKKCVLQCVAVCCQVLHLVAVCCSALQCVAVGCSVLQCVAVCFNVSQCVAVCRRLCVTFASLSRALLQRAAI